MKKRVHTEKIVDMSGEVKEVRKIKRSTAGIHTAVRMDKRLIARLDKLADRTGTTRSTCIRNILREYFWPGTVELPGHNPAPRIRKKLPF